MSAKINSNLFFVLFSFFFFFFLKKSAALKDSQFMQMLLKYFIFPKLDLIFFFASYGTS